MWSRFACENQYPQYLPNTVSHFKVKITLENHNVWQRGILQGQGNEPGYMSVIGFPSDKAVRLMYETWERVLGTSLLTDLVVCSCVTWDALQQQHRRPNQTSYPQNTHDINSPSLSPSVSLRVPDTMVSLIERQGAELVWWWVGGGIGNVVMPLNRSD